MFATALCVLRRSNVLACFAPCRSSQTLTDTWEEFFGDQLDCLGSQAFWHPSPFGTHYHMVRTNAAMNCQNLLRDFIGRPDQKAVADQAGELLVEAAVIRRQFLSPRVISLVLGAEIRGAESHR